MEEREVEEEKGMTKRMTLKGKRATLGNWMFDGSDGQR